MKNKHRILNALKDVSVEVKKMSVGELIEKLTKDVQSEQDEESLACKKVCSKFRGMYIKITDDDGMFGPEKEFIYIEDIEPGSFTTDYERTFDIKGHKISFSERLNSSRDMKMGDVHDCMTEKELNSAEEITQKEYKKAHMQLKIIKKMAKDMFN